MKVCVILSDDYKRKLHSITKYQNIILAATLFQLYKQQSSDNYSWLASRIGSEVMCVHADILCTPPRVIMDLITNGRFEPHYISDLIPVLQYNLTRLLS